MKVRCIEQIQRGGITFRTGETYTASEINKNWYVVDSIGVESEEFTLHFEEMLTEEEVETKVIYVERKVEQEELPELFDEDKTNEEYKETWWDRFMSYVFA
jgi:hypothetical protein